MPRIDSFLRLVTEQRASDLHLHAGIPPLARLNGELIPLPFRELSEEDNRRFLHEILSPAQRDLLHVQRDLDFVYELPGIARFRGNAFQQSRGLGVVLRVIPCGVPSLNQLGMPPAVRRLTSLGNGLVLVTGPTGCGKSTTLAAIVQEINETQQRHVITIEDPIEFVHQPVRSWVTQREVGTHTESFAGALRSALRESPDVVVVGELRDLETVSLALSAAEMGVLVFGTLHTNSCAKSVHRIVDMMPAEGRDQTRGVVSVLLRAVLAQRLCRRRIGEGMVAAVEVLLQDYGVAHMIRDDKIHQLDAYLQSATPEATGMQSMDRSLLDLARADVIEPEEAVRLAAYPERMREAVRGLVTEEED